MNNNSPPWSDDWTGQRQVVQVRIPGARRSYAYTWDGEPLEIGDWVLLPGNQVSPAGTEGRVDGFGADGYKGPMKAIVSRQEKQDPWIARMRQVQNPAQRLQVYRRAKKAGVSGERLAKLVETGREVLAESDRGAGDRARAAMARLRSEGPSDASDVAPPLTSAEDAAEHRARHTGSLGRVDAGSSQQSNDGWGEWE